MAERVELGSAFVRFEADMSALLGRFRELRDASQQAGEQAATTFSNAFKKKGAGIDPSAGFVQAMSKTKQALNFKIPSTFEKLSGSLQAATSAAGPFAGQLTRISLLLVSTPLGLLITGLAAIVGGMISAGKAAVDFDREFKNVAVLMDDTGGNIDQARRDILNMNSATDDAVSRAKLLEIAFRNTGAQSIEEAKAVTEAGLALQALGQGAADTATTVNVIGDLMDAFRGSTLSAGDAAALLFSISKQGGGSLKDLTGQLESLSDTVSELGGSLNEVGAALVVLGNVAAGSPTKNARALDQALKSVTANRQRFIELGIDVEALQEKFGPIRGTLEALKQAGGGSASQLRELGISGRALTTIMKLLGGGLDQFDEKLRGLSTETARADFAKAIDFNSRQVSTALDKAGIKIEDFKTAVGTMFIKPGYTGSAAAADQQAFFTDLKKVDKAVEDLAKEEAFLTDEQRGQLESLRELSANLHFLEAQRREALKTTKQTTEEQEQQTTTLQQYTAALAGAATETSRLDRAQRENIREVQKARKDAEVEALRTALQGMVASVEQDKATTLARLQNLKTVQDAEEGLATTVAGIRGQDETAMRSFLERRLRLVQEEIQAEITANNARAELERQQLDSVIALRERELAQLKEREGFATNKALILQAIDLEKTLTGLRQDRATKEAQFNASRIQLDERANAEAKKGRLELEKFAIESEQRRLQNKSAMVDLEISLGRRTLQDHAIVQAQMARLTREGSDAQIKAYQGVVGALQSLQGAARGVMGQIASELSETFEDETIINLNDIQNALAVTAQKDADVLNRVASGFGAQFGDFKKALGRIGLFEQFRQLGANITEVFRLATTQIGTMFDQMFGRILGSATGFQQALLGTVAGGPTQPGAPIPFAPGTALPFGVGGATGAPGGPVSPELAKAQFELAMAQVAGMGVDIATLGQGFQPSASAADALSAARRVVESFLIGKSAKTEAGGAAELSPDVLRGEGSLLEAGAGDINRTYTNVFAGIEDTIATGIAGIRAKLQAGNEGIARDIFETYDKRLADQLRREADRL